MGRIWKELYERKEYDKIYHMKKIGKKAFPSVVRKRKKRTHSHDFFPSSVHTS